ncbi:hypothetical protein [Streptomyces sp. NBC_01591]|nr:hypothetical protein [Streptomyces sp. NBC_01591]
MADEAGEDTELFADPAQRDALQPLGQGDGRRRVDDFRTSVRRDLRIRFR